MKKLILAGSLLLFVPTIVYGCNIWILWKTWTYQIGSSQYAGTYRGWETMRVYFTYKECEAATKKDSDTFRCFPMGYSPR